METDYWIDSGQHGRSWSDQKQRDGRNSMPALGYNPQNKVLFVYGQVADCMRRHNEVAEGDQMCLNTMVSSQPFEGTELVLSHNVTVASPPYEQPSHQEPQSRYFDDPL